MATDNNPCLACGACCARFKVAFHWSEASDAGGTVPVELTEDLDTHRRVMSGTRWANPRCIALHGEIGGNVCCTIYEQRSTTCREFTFSWEHGEPHDKCDRARLAWGLAPLQAPQGDAVPAPPIDLPGIPVHSPPTPDIPISTGIARLRRV